MEEKISQILKKVFNMNIQSKTSEAGNSRITDGQLEANLTIILKEKYKLSKLDKKELSKNNSFLYYRMELFDKEKNLINSSDFGKDGNYYYIKNNNDYFIIKSNDFSKLYYYNEENNINKKIIGFKEDQIKSQEYTKFYLTEAEPQKMDSQIEGEFFQDNKDTFLEDVKFNLISDKTISFYGDNNNISQDYLRGYYAKGKLLSKGKHPFILGFGPEIEPNSTEGVFHYSMDNYYVKLSSIKGQYDGAYKNGAIILLDDFKSRIIFSNFESIPENSKILFEFKNGKGGAKKVIEQAINYRKTSKVILKDDEYYHIIIVAKSSLGNSLQDIIKNNKSLIDTFNNFAIICLDDEPKICEKNFPITSDNKSKNETKSSKSSKNTETQQNVNPQLFQENLLKTFQENIINTLKEDLEKVIEEKIQKLVKENMQKEENTKKAFKDVNQSLFEIKNSIKVLEDKINEPKKRRTLIFRKFSE